MDLPRATVKTHVYRLRQRYREIVRREIGRTVSSPHEVDEEAALSLRRFSASRMNEKGTNGAGVPSRRTRRDENNTTA